MTPPEMDGLHQDRLRTMQLLAGTLLAGVIVFMAMVVYVRQQNHGAVLPQDSPLTWVSLGVGGLLIAAHWLLPDWIVAGQLQKIAFGSWRPAQALPPGQSLTDAWALTTVYQTRLVMAVALLEGAAFLCLVAYLLEGEHLCLLGAALSVVLMALRHPTPHHLEHWLEQKRSWLEQERTR